ncbi:MAG TPA: SUF system NifU family Fe-S cluster assembly protein [Haliangiales bacterium]|nr:SUF system NifU family Fe-S cluster assembly protein [Haliangiales bacterium]
MNDAVRALYQGVILDHHKSPRNHGPLADATHRATADNPLCGDRVTVHLVVADRIDAARFEARGCALSRASGSLLTEAAVGKTPAEARELAARFEAFVAGSAPAPDDALAVFAGVREFPSRAACAVLPWQALVRALETA